MTASDSVARRGRAMTEVSIAIHANGAPDFRTSDARTIAAIRGSLDLLPVDTWLVPAHELAGTLRRCGRDQWAELLEEEEESHVVTVRFRG
jgi:hypothetical protein